MQKYYFAQDSSHIQYRRTNHFTFPKRGRGNTAGFPKTRERVFGVQAKWWMSMSRHYNLQSKRRIQVNKHYESICYAE
jgi:hypothetical protein